MTKAEEERVLGIIAGLLNAVHDLQHGNKLVTDAFILLEKRMNDIEAAQKPKSSIIIPTANVAGVINGKAN